MKTKLFISGMLLFAVPHINAQTTATTTKTTHGEESGQLFGPNVHIGYQAGNASSGNPNPTGIVVGIIPSNNSFVGYQAGKANYNGSNNTFLGFQAGILNYNADKNVFLGAIAGAKNTSGEYNVFTGYAAGNSNVSGGNNTFTGYNCGFKNTASNNCFYGYQSGYNTTTGGSNIFIGSGSGHANSTGSDNVFSGTYSGVSNTQGAANAFYGNGSGNANTTGSYNVHLGFNSGYSSNSTIGKNVYLGAGAGSNNTSGGANVFVGFESGKFETGSNKLYLANTSTSAPLVYGDFSTGKVGIGGMNSFPANAGSIPVGGYKLFVKGGILTEEVRVHLATGWADYVFADDYKLPTLNEVEKYIADNGHLPNVPSAQRVKEDGIELGQMANIQQEKIEELTLYAIQQNKQIETQKSQLEQQQKEIDELKAAVKALVAKQ
ncbi:FtsB/FtsL family cell division protein [Flavobacterium hauense]